MTFHESEAAEYRLIVDASVRPSMVAVPDRLSIRIRKGETLNASPGVIVQNFTQVPWSGLSVSSDAEWIQNPHVTEVELTTDTVGAATQQWLCRFDLSTTDLDVGEYSSRIEVSPRDAETASLRVPVHLRVNSPVQVSPEIIFFSSVTRGDEAVRTASFELPDGIELSQLTVSHDLGSEFHADVAQREGRQCVLTVAVLAKQPGRVAGRIVVETADGMLAELSVIANIIESAGE